MVDYDEATKSILFTARMTWRTPRSAATLRWRRVILAVNKIDLVDYDEATFRAIEEDFHSIALERGDGHDSGVGDAQAIGDGVEVQLNLAARQGGGVGVEDMGCDRAGPPESRQVGG